MPDRGSFARSRQWLANARFSEGLKTLAEARTIASDEKTRKALTLFQEAVAIDPGFGRAHFYVGIASELRGEHRRAIEEFEGLVGDDRAPRLELLYNLALSWFHVYETQGYGKALAYIDAIVRECQAGRSGKRPDVADEMRRMSTLLLAKTLRSQVLSHRAIRENGAAAEATRQEATSEATSVLEYLEKNLNALPAEVAQDVRWGAWNALGHIDHMGGRHKDVERLKKAEKAFDKALEYSPGNYRVLSNLAANHLFIAQLTGERDRLQQAKTLFDQVIGLRTDYDYAHYRLADVALEEEDYDEALRQIQLAREHPSEMTSETLDRLEEQIRERQPRKPTRAYNLDEL